MPTWVPKRVQDRADARCAVLCAVVRCRAVLCGAAVLRCASAFLNLDVLAQPGCLHPSNLDPPGCLHSSGLAPPGCLLSSYLDPKPCTLTLTP